VTLVPTTEAVPAVVEVESADRDPLAVYLARLGAGSRRTMLAGLELVARLLTDGRADAARLPWWELRYQRPRRPGPRL
jgi:hypothetical protein